MYLYGISVVGVDPLAVDIRLLLQLAFALNFQALGFLNICRARLSAPGPTG
jgi:hypothetical protein